jgi:hypothetical protein
MWVAPSLLRNMSAGLANGTRMVVTRMMHNVIQAKVATGPAKGQRVLLPRINLTPSDATAMPFDLCRRQFPVRVAYGMTINKSQGQTLKKAGVYLPRSVFSHGQLYVAFSRVGIGEALKVLVVGGFPCSHSSHCCWRVHQECGVPRGVPGRAGRVRDCYTPKNPFCSNPLLQGL